MENNQTMNDNCKANYTKETFERYYGESPKELRKCSGCPFMDYNDGMMTCKKFN